MLKNKCWDWKSTNHNAWAGVQGDMIILSKEFMTWDWCPIK